MPDRQMMCTLHIKGIFCSFATLRCRRSNNESPAAFRVVLAAKTPNEECIRRAYVSWAYECLVITRWLDYK